MVKPILAATIPPPKPAFKVAGSSVRHGGGYVRPGGGLVQPEPKENPWKKYRLKVFPRRINGKWYKPGEWVYRKRVHGPGGASWIYGDHFDFMRGK